MPIPEEQKLGLITEFASEFKVIAEIGEKDPRAIVAPYRWVEMIERAFEVGASQVVCEGRASGDSGDVPVRMARSEPVWSTRSSNASIWTG